MEFCTIGWDLVPRRTTRKLQINLPVSSTLTLMVHWAHFHHPLNSSGFCFFAKYSKLKIIISSSFRPSDGFLRADSRFAPIQWEAVILCNDVSHWLGASLESALIYALVHRVIIGSRGNMPLPVWTSDASDDLLYNKTWVKLQSGLLLWLWRSHPKFPIPVKRSHWWKMEI